MQKNMLPKMGRRLVLFPIPLVGHQNPMFELGNILHSKGFSISVICMSFNSPNPTKYPKFSFHFIDDGLSESEASMESEAIVEDAIIIFNLLNKKCIVPFKECLSQIISNASHEEPVACLITDAMLHFSQAVADGLKLPRIVLRTGNVSHFTLFFVLPRLREKGALKDKQPEDLIPELPPYRLKDTATVSERCQSQLLGLLSNVVRETKASKGLIFNSFEEIEDRSLNITRQEFHIPIFPVGPFHKWLPSSPSASLPLQEQNSLSWLNTQTPNSVLYVSFGSVASVDEAGLHEMAWGLANSNQPFLWVVRSDLVRSSNGSSLLPNDFLHEVSGRGLIVNWAPQKDVLGHPSVGGFWTHTGWNSTLESFCEGVPMICSPCFGDQMVNARYVSDVWNIGLQLEKGKKRVDVEKAIRKLMVEKEGEEMRERAASLKNKVSNCTLPGGGSSYKYMEDLVNLIVSF